MSRDMNDKDNSPEAIREKYRRIIEEYRKYILGIESGENVEEATTRFNRTSYKISVDDYYSTTPRGGIVSRKNFWGLSATTDASGKLYLKGNAGRFRIESQPISFPNTIDITDILDRSEDEQLTELEEFFDMNNREYFEKFGLRAFGEEQRKLVAESVLLDSLLKDKYSEIQDIFCHNNAGQTIEITLQDGIKITARDSHGITIEKDGRRASVNFDTINKAERRRNILQDINNLDVDNVVYAGDEELIGKLRDAMEEQFESQRENKEEQEVFPYQEALDLFGQLYFPEGISSPRDWDQDTIIRQGGYGNIATRRSEITGKNVFSPFVTVVPGEDGNEKYVLMLHKGKFLNIPGGNANVPDCDSIDITDMSKDEIMALVKEMLNMTNEEVLEKYKPKITEDKFIMSLILDDEVQRHLETTTSEVTTKYGEESYFSYITEDGKRISIRDYLMDEEGNHIRLDGEDIVIIDYLDAEEKEGKIKVALDGRSYDYGVTGDISAIKIKDIQYDEFPDNELLKRILSVLKSRFGELEASEHDISHEDIFNLVKERGRTGDMQTASENIGEKLKDEEKADTDITKE